jgi:hypothetical protein
MDVSVKGDRLVLRDTDRVIKQLEATKLEITRIIAQALLKHQFPEYANISVDRLSEVLIPSLDMILDYFRTNDAVTLKATIIAIAQDRVNRNYSINNLQDIISIIGTELENVIDTITEPNPADSKSQADLDHLKIKYKSRVESIKALSQVSVISTQLKKPQS